jgi:nitrate reductase gamma subunit
VNAIVFAYGPYFAVFGFLAARMYQWGILRNRPAPSVAPVSPATEAALVLGVMTVLLGHLTTSVAPGAMRALLSDPDRVAVIETVGLVGALLVAYGVAARLRRRVQALRAGIPLQGGPVAVLALLLVVCLSGVYLTISYRWMTVWYAYIFVPYTRSLLFMEPLTDAVAASPWAVQQHTLLIMLLVAAWPASGLSFVELFPIRAVARRFGEGAGARTEGASSDAAAEQGR